MKYLFFILLFYMQACKNENSHSCSIIFFESYLKKSNSDLQSVFKISTPQIIDNRCSYQHSLMIWKRYFNENQNSPVNFKFTGHLYEFNNVIYLKLKTGNIIKYFDFNMKEKETQKIDYNYYQKTNSGKNLKIKNNYSLILEEKFYDYLNKDSIYKFRFKDIGFTLKNDDLVFYVSHDNGVLGVYNSELFDNKDEIISYVGNIYIYKKEDNIKLFINNKDLR